MDKHQTEIFGQFTYSQSITYEDLLKYEKNLQENLENIYRDGGAEHLDFTPHGDLLMMQCAFESQNLEILRDIADEIASILPCGIRGKILCLEKDLISYHMFWLERGLWAEKEYQIPAKGPDGISVHKVEPVEDQEPCDDEESSHPEES